MIHKIDGKSSLYVNIIHNNIWKNFRKTVRDVVWNNVCIVVWNNVYDNNDILRDNVVDDVRKITNR